MLTISCRKIGSYFILHREKAGEIKLRSRQVLTGIATLTANRLTVAKLTKKMKMNPS
ncbi:MULTISPECIES: hypothetical protein [unclassified Nodularia (in: cyanobacteria)]|uniref:hypothetical protein n=1 Tax=unclassified Nodularia (in: cyanobacteria) TaxID=2656917 RepID=UPI00187FE917|nr:MULTISPECIES: hypothetical protein [unclassified Nodularia (in: cyanobacteria)]MBE9200631.1 hypothetical protein [Nodularia sp. LEGE 06071]MCC2694704.1 hypothetical protein [Nodularia sp. LEGE 04288]